jgi:hypothetical protein
MVVLALLTVRASRTDLALYGPTPAIARKWEAALGRPADFRYTIGRDFTLFPQEGLHMGKKLTVVLAVVAALAAAATWEVRRGSAADETGPKIVHDVYFALKDGSPDARQKFMAGCRKYLTEHPGEVYFAVGTVAEDFKRDVNDRDWDVGLHIVFKDRAAHDEYQQSARHKEFVAQNRDAMKKVRVFDTLVER